MAELSLEALLKEYARLGIGKGDDGMTTSELAEKWGIGQAAVRVRLRLAQRAGILRCGKKSVPTLSEQLHLAPCYWLETKRKKK